eukprot:SAG11_NODE_537_length_8672_cov_3.282632_3_plen_264_part_00
MVIIRSTQVICSFKRVSIQKNMDIQKWAEGLTDTQVAEIKDRAAAGQVWEDLYEIELEHVRKKGGVVHRIKTACTEAVYSSPDFELCQSEFCLKIVAPFRVQLSYDSLHEPNDEQGALTRPRSTSVTMLELHDRTFEVYLCHHSLSKSVGRVDISLDLQIGDMTSDDCFHFEGNSEEADFVSFPRVESSHTMGVPGWGFNTHATLQDMIGTQNYELFREANCSYDDPTLEFKDHSLWNSVKAEEDKLGIDDASANFSNPLRTL